MHTLPNGYVQRNLSFVSAHRSAQIKSGFKEEFNAPNDPRKPNTDIIQHNRKREIELKVTQLRDALEEQGVAEEEIERKVSETRKKLLDKLPKAVVVDTSAGRSGETHADAAAKQQENSALKEALGISSEYKGGSAFDRELQEKRRQERLADKAAQDAERESLLRVLEKEQEREERQRAKEERKREKAARKAEKKERKKQKRDSGDS